MSRPVAEEGAPELRLAPESIEALAVRLAELLRPGADPGAPVGAEEKDEGDEEEMISAAEVSRRYGVQRRWVYENREFLGAVELGTGPRPRLRFDQRVLDRRLGPPDGDERQADMRRSTWMRASRISDSLSSRSRANVARPSEFVSGAAVGRPPDAAPGRGRTD
jgi:hypothetical protein